MASPVGYLVIRVRWLTHQGKDHFYHSLVVFFAVGADEVSLTDFAVFEDPQYC
ncbi:hypothetical protein MMON44395_09590 [Mycolicibacterium monacense DSM 44395]|nr:hypothetical protein [Mycolicibacterium monacense DSM 44395]